MRSTVAVAALAALVLTGCAGAPGPLGPDPRGQEQPASSPPGPPPGPRAVGLGSVMVTAPADWARRSAYLCEGWTGDVVMLPAADDGRDRPGNRCGPVPLPGTSSLTFTTTDSKVPVVAPLTREVEAGGLALQAGPGCGRGSTDCTRVVEDPASGATLVVRMLGPGAAGRAAAVVDSIRPVPDGYAAVPSLARAFTTPEAVAILDAAGLRADVPTPSYPHYVTGSAPGPGTVVPLDRQVRIQVGDG